MNLRIDPELKALIPPLSKEEFEQLEKNILEEGCRDALIHWGGVILDGHNRFKICSDHGLAYETKELEFKDKAEARIWMRNNQMGRRNLTAAWRIELQLGNKEDLKKAGESKKIATLKQNQKTDVSENDTSGKPHSTRKEIAKAANTSTGQVGMAEQVRKKSPELWEKAKEGEESISGAYKKLQKQERAKEIQRERSSIAERAKKVTPSERFSVSRCDLRDYQPPAQVDAIITDPPYPREHLDLWSVLAERSNDWLKPGGIIVAMSGQAYLNQVYSLLDQHLEYYWTACYHTPGQPTPLRHVNVNTTWKPLLIYKRKGDKFKGKIFGDFMASDGNDKSMHKWGQSISGMNEVLKRFALPGQTVLDPFLGAGTTGVAAIKHGCIFYGCDIEQENVDISKARINDAIV